MQPSLPRPTGMSLSETSGQREEPHILPPPASYKMESSPREHLSTFPHIRMPPISQSAYDPSYDTYKSRPPVQHPLDYSEQHPTAPIRHILHQSNPPSLGLSPLQVSQFEFTAGSKQLKRQEDATSSTQRRQAKKIGVRREMRDEDYLHLNSSSTPLLSRCNDQDRPQGDHVPDSKGKGKESDGPSRESTSKSANSRPMQISELISNNNSTNSSTRKSYMYEPPSPVYVIYSYVLARMSHDSLSASDNNPWQHVRVGLGNGTVASLIHRQSYRWPSTTLMRHQMNLSPNYGIHSVSFIASYGMRRQTMKRQLCRRLARDVSSEGSWEPLCRLHSWVGMSEMRKDAFSASQISPAVLQEDIGCDSFLLCSTPWL